MTNIEKVLNALDNAHITYTYEEHPPIFTIDALDDFDLMHKHLIAKNLFLRNDNGKMHYLIVMAQDKEADLKKLRTEIKSSRLSFASEDRLMKCLGLTKGSVTPLGVINDEEGHVQVFFDKDLIAQPLIGVHPNDNRGTVWLRGEDLIAFLALYDHTVTQITIH